jgi:hypothetical protein
MPLVPGSHELPCTQRRRGKTRKHAESGDPDRVGRPCLFSTVHSDVQRPDAIRQIRMMSAAFQCVRGR